MSNTEVNGESIGCVSVDARQSYLDFFGNGFTQRPNRPGRPERSGPDPDKGGDGWEGHPANKWRVISKEWSPGFNCLKILRAMEIPGGGVMLENIVGENGSPAISSKYEPELAIDERIYTDPAGERRVGYVLIRRPPEAPHSAPARPEPIREGNQGLSGETRDRLRQIAGVLDLDEEEILERAVDLLAAWHEINIKKESE